MAVLSEGDIREDKLYFIRTPQRIFKTFVVDHESLNVHLKQSIKKFEKSFPQSSESNVKAWHSDYFTHQKTNDFKPLIDLTEKYAHYATKEHCLADTGPPYYFMVNNLWFAKYKQNDYTKIHNHFPAVWSACYYVDVEENAAPIVFGSKNWGDEEEIVIQPETGMLLLWFSTIPHRVERTFAKRTCICMNINLQWGNY